MTCLVANVYSANFSVRNITYLEKKNWTNYYQKNHYFCYCFSFDLQTLLLFRALKICQRMHIDDFTKISFENLFEFWVHIIHGTSFFSAFYTQLWRCVLYKGAYYTQTCTVLTYSMFYNFSMQCPIRISDSLLLVIAASPWERQQCVISN